MTKDSRPTIAEIRTRIGEEKEDVVEVDKTLLLAYCQCIEEFNPKWQNTTPPGFLLMANMSGGALSMNIPDPFPRKVAAGADCEFLKPIKVGDTITTSHEFTDIQDKSSEKGPRALMIFKSTHKNQKGEIVAISTGSIMSY